MAALQREGGLQRTEEADERMVHGDARTKCGPGTPGSLRVRGSVPTGLGFRQMVRTGTLSCPDPVMLGSGREGRYGVPAYAHRLAHPGRPSHWHWSATGRRRRFMLALSYRRRGAMTLPEVSIESTRSTNIRYSMVSVPDPASSGRPRAGNARTPRPACASPVAFRHQEVTTGNSLHLGALCAASVRICLELPPGGLGLVALFLPPPSGGSHRRAGARVGVRLRTEHR